MTSDAFDLDFRDLAFGRGRTLEARLRVLFRDRRYRFCRQDLFFRQLYLLFQDALSCHDAVLVRPDVLGDDLDRVHVLLALHVVAEHVL